MSINFKVISVPRFSNFVVDVLTQPDAEEHPLARVSLSEKVETTQGIPTTQVTLDLQAFNERGELVWLSKNVTIAGFHPGSGIFNPEKKSLYEAMEALKSIVEEQLKTLGFQVRVGRYALPQEFMPLNGVFDCAEWYKEEDDHYVSYHVRAKY